RRCLPGAPAPWAARCIRNRTTQNEESSQLNQWSNDRSQSTPHGPDVIRADLLVVAHGPIVEADEPRVVRVVRERRGRPVVARDRSAEDRSGTRARRAREGL